MWVFVATKEGQGDRTGDFFHAVEGELVRMPANPCSNPRCGCDRSVVGLSSSRATTTFMSVDRRELDPESYRPLFLEGVKRQGWVPGAGEDELMDGIVAWHIDAAVHYPPETVLRARIGSDGLAHVKSEAGCGCGTLHDIA